MNQVPDSVLRWLYNSLKPAYLDVERTYSDVAETLTGYPTLAPRTEVHTFENGTSALLLLLQGTIPIQFRGATYRYPLSIWIPHAYPREPPLVYINPTREMAVRPGQHVSIEGKIYHPYLADWASRWNDFNIRGLLSVLASVFSRDPPVIARPDQAELPSHSTSRISGAPPPLPRPGQADGLGAASSHMILGHSSLQSRGPPPPPKPSGVSNPGQSAGHRPDSLGNRLGSAAPPLPPKGSQSIRSPESIPAEIARPPRSSPYFPLPTSGPSRSETNGPPLPPLPGAIERPNYDRSGYGSRPPHPPPPPNARPTQYDDRYQQPSLHSPVPSQQRMQSPQPILQRTYQQQSQGPISQPLPQHQQHRHAPPPQEIPQTIPRFQGHQTFQPQLNVPVQPQPYQPAPDLLSAADEAIPGKSNAPAPAPAPPIPVNPQKDALLSAISARLLPLLSQIISQNSSAVPALQAQQASMQRSQQALTAELGALQQLDATLASNEQILRDAMREAEKMEKGLSGREVPGVDEVLVAPTVVAEQLYRLVAEERGIADALFVLGRALEKDRVAGEVFIKQTRSLAREQFLKKALIKKIANGMGLAVDGHQ